METSEDQCWASVQSSDAYLEPNYLNRKVY